MKKLYESFNDLLNLELSLLRQALPKDRAGDKTYSLICFIRIHNRIPTKNFIFNDILYHINTTDEILNPLRTFVTDKEYVKLYIKSVIGDSFNIPTLAVLKNEQEILSYDFPPECVIKPTHTSGDVIIRKNGETIDFSVVASWLNKNYYEISREANYRYLTPKIIIEPIVFNNPNIENFKVFCFDGKPKLIYIDLDKNTNHQRKFYDVNWNPLNISLKYPNPINLLLTRPSNLNQILAVAEKLSKPFSLVRVDFYSNGQEFYVGEITNLSGAALATFDSFESEMIASEILFN